ncbi:MAG: hypothetical protein FHP94_01995 [Denitromonas halophila]|nr:MAG: hypothetical protein FHP94_01995 [Denitromonas halophila]TVT71251.1 MAG: hypothetical protein FHP93_10390 [Denitromonas halophila]
MRTAPRRRVGRFILWLMAVAILVTGLVAWQFSDRWLGETLAEQINARLAGQVRIDGPVSLQVFPPRLTLAGVAWQGPGATPSTVQLDHLELHSDWRADGSARPLSIAIRGVRGQLRQQADGQWQVPTPLATAEAADDDAPVKLAALTVTEATVELIGLAMPASVRLAELKLIESPSGWQVNARGGASSAEASVDGAMSTSVEIAATGPRLTELTATFSGQVGPATIESLAIGVATVASAPDGAWQLAGVSTELRASGGDRQITLTAEADTGRYAGGGALLLGLQAKATLVPAGPADAATATLTGVDLALAGQQVTASGKAHVVTALAAGPVDVTAERFQVAADLASGRIEGAFPKVNAALPDPAKPGAQLGVHAALTGHWQTAERTGAGTVEAKVEDSRLKGQWQIALAQPRWLTVDAQVDRLNLDRWQAPGPRTAEALPLDAWRDWPLRLDLQVGRLRMQGLEAQNTRLRLNTPD